MRILTEPFLKAMAARFPQAAQWLDSFRKITRAAKWQSIMEMRAIYPHADAVTVRSQRTVIVLNVAGNKYRLIIAAHFNQQMIYTLRFLTHAEYSKNQWKNDL